MNDVGKDRFFLSALYTYVHGKQIFKCCRILHDFDLDCCLLISFSICLTHLLAKASSVNLFADDLARSRIATVSDGDIQSALANAVAYSVSLLA